MSEPMQDHLAEVIARAQATEEAVAKAEAELRQQSVTVQSANRAVRVTVGPQGELQDLEFLDGSYRDMAASELATTILDAANQARAEMARRVVDAFSPITEAMPRSGESDGVDWQKIFGSMLEQPGQEPQHSAMSRLRDEIHEDEDDQVDGLPRDTSRRTQPGGR